MLWRLLRSAITPIVFAVRGFLEGKPPKPRKGDELFVDCPDHGKTTLTVTRLTACCNSLQFVPSGSVASRSCRKRAGRKRRRKATIICEPDRGYPLEPQPKS